MIEESGHHLQGRQHIVAALYDRPHSLLFMELEAQLGQLLLPIWALLCCSPVPRDCCIMKNLEQVILTDSSLTVVQGWVVTE